MIKVTHVTATNIRYILISHNIMTVYWSAGGCVRQQVEHFILRVDVRRRTRFQVEVFDFEKD